jgi:hypothetical protein
MAWENFDAGIPVTLDVTTLTPEPASFLLFGSAFARLRECCDEPSLDLSGLHLRLACRNLKLSI